MQQIVHISDTHSAFDDRIFFKELKTLSQKYECYEIIVSADSSVLHDMGGLEREPGNYDGITCVPISFFGGNSFYVKVIRRFLPRVYNRIKYIGVEKKVTAYFKRNKISPAIVHYHDLSFAKTAKRISETNNCKLIFDCHEFYFSFCFEAGFTFKNLIKSDLTLLRIKKAVKNADYVISVTKTLDNILSLMKKDDNHAIIYNSSILPFQVEEEKTLGNRKLVLIHEGILKFNYGLKMMVEMFNDSYIRDNFKLKIIGKLDAPEKAYYEEMVSKLQLTNENIEITGWVKYDELPKVEKGDAGIIFFEKSFNYFFSMPNRLYNYHCAGLPVLSTHCADLSDMIKETNTGIIFERNMESLKKCLKALKNNYNEYYQNVLNNKSKYSWSNEEAKLFCIYDELLNGDKNEL